MDSITNYDYLWQGKLREYEKFIIPASDDRRNHKPLFMAGVYFLWNQDGLQYIGQSWFVLSRLENHHIFKKAKASEWIIGVIPMEDERERLFLEAYCIGLFRPPKNVMKYGGGGRRKKP